MSNVEFPISLALIGAPGSGKKEVAGSFAKIALPFLAENNQVLHILHNTGAVLEEHYDTPMGVFGDYKENLEAFYLRYEREKKFRRDGESFITCGSIIENMAYGGVKVEDIRTGLQTPDIEQRVMKEMHATTVMSFLFLDTFRYTFGFYLPLPDTALVLPGSTDSGERAHAKRIDEAIRTIFANFGLRIQILDQGSPNEKAQIMLDTIKRIMEDEPTPEEEATEVVPPAPQGILPE